LSLGEKTPQAFVVLSIKIIVVTVVECAEELKILCGFAGVSFGIEGCVSRQERKGRQGFG
jgi:hypothetical protein